MLDAFAAPAPRSLARSARARYPSANAPRTCGTTCPLRWGQRRPSSSRDRAGRAEAFGVGTPSRVVASSAVAAFNDDAACFAGAGGSTGGFEGGAVFLIRSFCCDHFAPTSGAGPRVFCADPAPAEDPDPSRSNRTTVSSLQCRIGTSGAMSTMSLNFFLLFDGAGMMNRFLSRRAGCPGDGPWRVRARPAVPRFNAVVHVFSEEHASSFCRRRANGADREDRKICHVLSGHLGC